MTLNGTLTLQLQMAVNGSSQTIYYTSGLQPANPACGEHREWAGLACQTQPAKQPETTGLPNIPATVVTYNVWDEPELDGDIRSEHPHDHSCL